MFIVFIILVDKGGLSVTQHPRLTPISDVLINGSSPAQVRRFIVRVWTLVASLVGSKSSEPSRWIDHQNFNGHCSFFSTCDVQKNVVACFKIGGLRVVAWLVREKFLFCFPDIVQKSGLLSHLTKVCMVACMSIGLRCARELDLTIVGFYLFAITHGWVGKIMCNLKVWT
jgi:hypothetical protein